MQHDMHGMNDKQMPEMKHGMQMNEAGMYLMNMSSGTSMNPQAWPYGKMRNMMHHHLKITTSEVLSVLHGGTGADAYNGVHRQAMQMADMLTAGIQKQFGGKRVAVR